MRLQHYNMSWIGRISKHIKNERSGTVTGTWDRTTRKNWCKTKLVPQKVVRKGERHAGRDNTGQTFLMRLSTRYCGRETTRIPLSQGGGHSKMKRQRVQCNNNFTEVCRIPRIRVRQVSKRIMHTMHATSRLTEQEVWQWTGKQNARTGMQQVGFMVGSQALIPLVRYNSRFNPLHS